jgi:hypothetical protein
MQYDKGKKHKEKPFIEREKDLPCSQAGQYSFKESEKETPTLHATIEIT